MLESPACLVSEKPIDGTEALVLLEDAGAPVLVASAPRPPRPEDSPGTECADVELRRLRPRR
jgi:hypothetical protein